MKQITYRIDVKLIRPDGSAGVVDPDMYGAAITGYYSDDPRSDDVVELAERTLTEQTHWSHNVIIENGQAYTYTNGKLQFFIRRKPTRKDLKLVTRLVDTANMHIQATVPADVTASLTLVSKIEVTRVTVTTSYEKVKIPDVV